MCRQGDLKANQAPLEKLVIRAKRKRKYSDDTFQMPLQGDLNADQAPFEKWVIRATRKRKHTDVLRACAHSLPEQRATKAVNSCNKGQLLGFL